MYTISIKTPEDILTFAPIDDEQGDNLIDCLQDEFIMDSFLDESDVLLIEHSVEGVVWADNISEHTIAAIKSFLSGCDCERARYTSEKKKERESRPKNLVLHNKYYVPKKLYTTTVDEIEQLSIGLSQKN